MERVVKRKGDKRMGEKRKRERERERDRRMCAKEFFSSSSLGYFENT